MQSAPRPVVLPLVLFVACAVTASAQSDAGLVTFANSGAKDAQQSFLHGLAQLHNFEYGAALRDFKKAESIDPAFAMAYWGEAMTYTHPVWNTQDRNGAISALDRLGATPQARMAKAPTQRERDYLATLDILYGEGEKKDRDQRYSDAMARLSQTYPDDVDAAAFYALALLGTAEGVRDERTYMRAAGILMPLFYKFPHHPGVAHYLIHACDDPVHAPLALPAALAYSGIAPAAAHAQHMTSHIFLALGMWNELVSANEAAMSTVKRAMAAHGKSTFHCGHYNYWLEYGYLETGHVEQARQVVEACRGEASSPGMAAAAGDVADPDDSSVLSFLQMQRRYVADTAQPNGDVGNWTVDAGETPLAQFYVSLERGWRAVGSRDTADARRQLAGIDELLTQLPAVFDRAGSSPEEPLRKVPAIERKQLEAMILSAEGHIDQAVAIAQSAAAEERNLPYAFGPPSPEKPSYELLGELLLQQNRPRDAEAAFKQALMRAPNRTQTLAALQRAHSLVSSTPN